MGSESVARWKDPLYSLDGDTPDDSPVGQIEILSEMGGLEIRTGEGGTLGCCAGGTLYAFSAGCCNTYGC